jgi:two-component system, sensor histidine kinase and response regulator
MEEQPGRVLVVDDHPQNVELLEAYLIPEGYDGIEALERVEEGAPDIVLLDVMMPRMDGYEVCQKMKEDESTRFIPIVMVTALKELEDKIKSIEAGADDFLTKPIVKIELLTRIRSLIRVKRLHDDLEKSYKELKDLEKTKENLTQMIIHDLKNPLTGIKANLEIVGMEELNDTQECLEAAQRSSDLLYNMIQDLLDISKLEEEKLNLILESVTMPDLADAARSEVEAPANAEDKEIKLDIPEGLPAINMDRQLIYRVISNLLLNAIKHTGRGGVITLRAGIQGDVIQIDVADTGHGIPQDYLEAIFEKFGQVESRSRTGTGLGLTFCKMAVEAHGGKIWVESVEGEGSTFSFTLPLESKSA